MTAKKTIAFFISPHGFGHASRGAAVMEAKHDLDPSLKFEIFTKVPRWFFAQSLTGAFEYHSFLKEGDFRNGRWLSFLRKLLAFPRINRQGPRGAEQVALFVLDLLDSSLP